MSFKSIVRELREMRDGIGSMSRRGTEGKLVQSRARSQNSGSGVRFYGLSAQQSRWANLPPELLLDVIRRVEESEASWPARKHVVACASVCRSWREITKEIVKTPEECGRLTFPISLKQVLFIFSTYVKMDSFFFLFLYFSSYICVCLSVSWIGFAILLILVCFLFLAWATRFAHSMLYQKGTSYFDLPAVSRFEPW